MTRYCPEDSAGNAAPIAGLPCYSYTYRASGELLAKVDLVTSDSYAYSYDELGALRTVFMPDDTTITYEIDAAGRRVGKRVNGAVVQRWLYKDGLEPVAELDGSNNVVSTFVYGTRAHVPDFMVRGGVTYRYVTDHLGSVVLVVNASTGAIAQRLAYDEFGNVLDNDVLVSGFSQPFGFAGGLYDPDTQLTRFGARDYDAVTGRWTAKDPLLFGGGSSNLYEYAYGDPINFVDPDGRWAFLVPIGMGAFGGAAAAIAGGATGLDVAKAAFVGGVAGAAALGASSVAGAYAISGLASAAASAVTDLWLAGGDASKVNWEKAGLNGAFGVAGAGLGAAVGKLTTPVSGRFPLWNDPDVLTWAQRANMSKAWSGLAAGATTGFGGVLAERLCPAQ